MTTRDLPATRRGYDAHEVVSALQKAIRRSDPDSALYWSFELAKSGLGNWLWKRIRIVCSEDVGLAGGVEMPAAIRALNDNWLQETKKDPNGGDLYIAHAVILLATAPKSRLVDWAVWHHNSDYVPRREVPNEALDRHTLAGKRKGRGWQHFLDEASTLMPFESSLEVLETDYRQKARLKIDAWEHGADVPTPNPWSSASGGTPSSAPTGGNPAAPIEPQLQLDRDEESR